MPKRVGISALAKQAGIVLAGLALCFFGVILLSFGRGSPALPPEPPYRPYPVEARPPNPLLITIGAAMLVMGIATFVYFQVYVYFLKWRNHVFDGILIRFGDRPPEYLIIARDIRDPMREVQLSEHDALLFSSRVPSTSFGRKLGWYLWKGITDDRDEYYVVFGSIAPPISLGEYTSAPLFFRGWFSLVKIRDLSATYYTDIVVMSPEEQFKLRFPMRRDMDLDVYRIPIAVIRDSDRHALLEKLIQVDTPYFGGTSETLAVLQKVSELASNKIVNVYNEREGHWKEVARGFKSLLETSSPYQMITRGFMTKELAPGERPPQPIGRRLLMGALITVLAVSATLAILVGLRVLGVI